MDTALAAYLADRHGVKLVLETIDDLPSGNERKFNSRTNTLYLAPGLSPGQRAFQMATQLAFLELSPADSIRSRDRAGFRATRRARLPYRARELLRRCAALSVSGVPRGRRSVSLRHRSARRAFRAGIPGDLPPPQHLAASRCARRPVLLHPCRSRRQHLEAPVRDRLPFLTIGGTCPLWNVYEAFAQPGRILTQHAQMPDGRRYLWIARTVASGQGGYGATGKLFAVALGCDAGYAERLVYSQGLDLRDPNAVTPIGMGCKVCERPACPSAPSRRSASRSAWTKTIAASRPMPRRDPEVWEWAGLGSRGKPFPGGGKIWSCWPLRRLVCENFLK